MKKLLLLIILALFGFTNVTYSQITCPSPVEIFTTNFSTDTVAITWTETGSATQWEILLDGVDSIFTTSNPFILEGLMPGVHTVTIRAICDTNDLSEWSNLITFVIQATQPCLPPTQISTESSITQTSVAVSWNFIGNANYWEVLALPCGSPTPTSTTTGNSANNPTVITGLNPNTCYNFYVRVICNTNEVSDWSIATIATTLPETANPLSCGGQFIDNGGIAANYPNSSNQTYTICPSQPGDAVTVTFTSFATEATWDGMYVYNGNSTSATQISSTNLAGNVPGGGAGAFWGTAIPGPFTSTDPTGCLTFRFLSDSSVNYPGWVSNITCSPLPTCLSPTLITVIPTSFTDATVSWNETGSATQWEVVLNGGAPIVTSTNPFLISGLTPGGVNIVMVRAICSPTDSSNWTVFTFIMPSCNIPTNGTATGITSNGATIGWSNQGSTQWEVLILPTGSPAPTATSSGTGVTTMSYIANGLTFQTTYDVYIRSLCNFNSTSDWSNVVTFTTLSASPYINANTTQYSSEQLVTNILVNNPCIGITNVTSSTGTNFGSVNGIGYFTNTNPSFPLTSGIILSSGNAMNAHGPNTSTISDGTSAWLGDIDLEAIILAATGQNMNSKNATKLEFDFTSLNEFMSFNFLFASEEYGTFQCAFSDAFAFLLTDLATGITTNLAVVPGTTTPVSVVTIRDMINNNGCSSVNPAFFGAYNLGNNVNSSATNFNGQTVLMTASSAILPNHPYHIKLVVADRQDNVLDSAVFIEAGTFTSGPPECNQRVQLVAFVDTNNNGIKDTGENNFSYGSFQLQENNSGPVTNISSPFGSYTIYDSTSTTYDFGYQINSEYSAYYTVAALSFNDINIALNTQPILYFPVSLTQGYNDLTVSISPLSPPRPGFNYTNKVVYTNLGVIASSGTVSFVKDPSVSIASISQSGTVNNASGFSYDFVNLQPYESRSFNVTMSIPAIPTVNINDLLTNSATISAPANDINLTNNSASNTQIVVAAYDPNDITEAHGGKIQYSQFSTNDYLYYTIRFQNTGTASAINVRLENLLNTQLDENSIRMVSSSHNYIMEKVNNQMVWKFNYINLVSYLQNEEQSKGYVTFKIKVKPGFSVGTIIPSVAEIYFDTNPAIVTNTFNTEFVASLGIANFSSNNLMLFPNPANDRVQINLQNTSETIDNIQINDILGKNIRTINNVSSNQNTIDVSNLSQGVYLLTITTENNFKIIKKLVIE